MKIQHNFQKIKKFSFILPYIKGYLYLFILSILCSIFNTTLNSLTPQIIKIVVDSVIGQQVSPLFRHLEHLHLSDNNLWTLVLFSAILLFISIIAGVFSFFSRSTLALGSEQMVKSLRDKLFEHIQRLPLSWHSKNQTGDIIQRCTSDVDVVRNFFANQMPEVFRTFFLISISLCIMFAMNVKIAMIAFIFLPVVAIYSGFFYSKISKRFQLADQAEGILSSTVQENLTGVRVVRAFGRERYEIDRFDEKNNHFSNLWIKLGGLMSYYWGTGDFITGLQILAVILVGTIEAVNGTITVGEFLAFISYNSMLVWPVRGLGRILSDMSKAGVSIDRLRDILDAQEEKEPSDSLTPSMFQDIHFMIKGFSYETQQPILNNIDFTIKAGSTFAILGGTGSGKSTLMHLLARLYDLPDGCGKITIGGLDVRCINRNWIRQNIGLILQEPFLYSRSIYENIGITQSEPDFTKIREAAKTAHIDQAIHEFENGYQTIIGERGVTLSGGQKQRVAIARTLIQNTPIVIFDDSLSAVDTQTDSEIRLALKQKLTENTVILISHRITTVMQADCILVLKDGKIAEIGTHAQLLSMNGIYKDIYSIQMGSNDKISKRKGL